MSYLIMCFGCKANKCSCFSSKKWHRGLANFGNGAIISALARPDVVKNGWDREVEFRGVEGKYRWEMVGRERKRGDIFWRIT